MSRATGERERGRPSRDRQLIERLIWWPEGRQIGFLYHRERQQQVSAGLAGQTTAKVALKLQLFNLRKAGWPTSSMTIFERYDVADDGLAWCLGDFLWL